MTSGEDGLCGPGLRRLDLDEDRPVREVWKDGQGVKCQVCLGEDAGVKRYREVPAAELPGGNYHAGCALQVGYNEWDEES